MEHFPFAAEEKKFAGIVHLGIGASFPQSRRDRQMVADFVVIRGVELRKRVRMAFRISGGSLGQTATISASSAQSGAEFCGASGEAGGFSAALFSFVSACWFDSSGPSNTKPSRYGTWMNCGITSFVESIADRLYK